MAIDDPRLRIGELARRCDVTPDTIRFYERKELLPRPQRTSSGYRTYGAEDEARLLFIREAQALGLTLADIGELIRLRRLDNPDECRRVASLLRHRLQLIDEKIEDLRAFRHRLATSLELCDRADHDSCPVVLDLTGEPERRKR